MKEQLSSDLGSCCPLKDQVSVFFYHYYVVFLVECVEVQWPHG